MMNESLVLLLAFISGGALGTIFYGGLWWTVCRAMSSRQPALWFSISLPLRMSIAIAGFYFVSDSKWERLLSCMIGFGVARTIVTILTRRSIANETISDKAFSHAP